MQKFVFGSFFFMNLIGGMLLMFFGLIQAGFAGGWASGDKFQIIIGFLFMFIGFLSSVVFATMLKRVIRGVL